ncbi:cyclin-like protein [Cucurbitaria berberidis CBS 394.84]|uniref:RNA polymerase II holoenzyme cyclin-like subunit n=1 Tax=Cucurbitaria berberidis CBS 394.84 TaxID=1168544 RepID=A0A9P4LDY1_9PLEO|nr:cyclin-like protein [Cucurbitaria berberidis CBS 394.84]KAF1850852.1 cyclin-like protein [Cucurbitaria berberidis CBS 394.84]
MKLTEDDLYRNSTQFRNWSFTSQQLAAQRLTTNIQATERVKANVARQRAHRAQHVESDSISSGVENGSGANTPNAVASDREVDCLTVDEELKIVDDFCERAIKLGEHCRFPFEVTATCIQYLRRFYLYNSPMTYHVHNISRTVMFLATKVEVHNLKVDEFAAFFTSASVTTESILAPEYMVMQGLRYNLDVRHPFRGLAGGRMEMLECAGGRYEGPGSGDDIQAQMLQLPKKKNGPAANWTVENMENRINNASFFASKTLKEAALLTDAYFLYTPSHIWLAAHLLADEPLTLFYIGLKIPTSSPIYDKLLSTIHSCAKLISSHRLYINATLPKEEKTAREANHQAEIKRLIGKLKMCRDPDKIDLVKLNQAQKRDAMQGDGGLEQGKAKRRKLERESYEKEADAFWGPELPKNG